MNPREIITDLSRRYSETYLWVKMPDGAKTLCWCSGIIPTAKSGEIHLTSGEFGKLVLNINTNHELMFNQPRVGVFQHGREAFMFRRVPNRQYRRGLCSQNGSIMSTTRAFVLSPANMLRDSHDLALVQAAYDGATHSLDTAFTMLNSGKARSVALANDFSLSLNVTADASIYLVFYMDAPIAQVSKEGKLVHTLEAIFSEELQGMFPS